MLSKWTRERPRMVLIAPDWQAQDWYPSLAHAASDRIPLILGHRDLVQPRSGITHGTVAMLSTTTYHPRHEDCGRVRPDEIAGP